MSNDRGHTNLLRQLLTGVLMALMLIPMSVMAATGDMRFDPANSSGTDGLIQVQDSRGSWGYVCDDYIDQTHNSNLANAMTVAENYFNEASCTESTVYNVSPNNNFILDDVQCAGTESTWYDCPRNPDYDHNCSTGEAFGITCADVISTPVPTMSIWGLAVFVALVGLIGFVSTRKT